MMELTKRWTLLSLTAGLAAAATAVSCTASESVARAVSSSAALTGEGTHGDGYARAKFGEAWADVDGNGCDTRNDILARYVTEDRLAANRCTVLSGRLKDPYTSAELAFRRGTPQPVQIDHIVSLHTAWHAGASKWNNTRRRAFANDPTNLLPTTLNSTKGDRAPAALFAATRDSRDKWKPSPAGQCTYARRFTLAAAEWNLTLGAADRAALAQMLARCPD